MTMDVFAIVHSKLISHLSHTQAAVTLDCTTSLRELDIDSLALMEVVYELEEYFATTVNDNDLKQISTVGDLVMAIDRSLKSAA